MLTFLRLFRLVLPIRIVAQIIFFAVTLGRGWADVGPLAPQLSSIPAWVYAFVFTTWIIVVILQEFAKSVEKKEFRKSQRRSKLVFNTKLGMHSPV